MIKVKKNYPLLQLEENKDNDTRPWARADHFAAL
jgi:hypothetical protein